MALQERGKKKQRDGKKIFNRNEKEAPLGSPAAQLRAVNPAPKPSGRSQSNDERFQFLSVMHKTLALESSFLRLNKLK